MKNCTDISCIIDASGSMGPLVDETITSFNKFLDEQQSIPGEASITLVTFNSEYKFIHQGIKLVDCKPFNHDTYRPHGSTALLDAVGKTIDEVGNRLAGLDEQDRPDKVVFFIVTDGEENCSVEYNAQQIKDKIKLQQETYNWTFIFAAANQDAFTTGASYGIAKAHTSNFVADSAGTQELYRSTSNVLRSIRTSNSIKH